MKNEDIVRELMLKVVGIAVKQLLASGRTLNTYDLIGELLRIKISSQDMAMQNACNHAIKLIIQKLN